MIKSYFTLPFLGLVLILSLSCGGGGGGSASAVNEENGTSVLTSQKVSYKPSDFYVYFKGDKIVYSQESSDIEIENGLEINIDSNIDLRISRDKPLYIKLFRKGIPFLSTLVSFNDVNDALSKGVLITSTLTPLTTFIVETARINLPKKASVHELEVESRFIMEALFDNSQGQMQELNHLNKASVKLKYTNKLKLLVNRINLFALYLDFIKELPVNLENHEIKLLESLYDEFVVQGDAQSILNKITSASFPWGKVDKTNLFKGISSLFLPQQSEGDLTINELKTYFINAGKEPQAFISSFSIPTGRVAGTINGASKSGIKIVVRGKKTYETLTKADGTYYVDNVEEGSYTVEAIKEGHIFEPPVYRLNRLRSDRYKGEIDFLSYVKGSLDVPKPSDVMLGITYTSSDGKTLMKGSFKPLDPSLIASFFRTSLDGVEFVLIDGTTVSGSLSMPNASDVKAGVKFGLTGSDQTGTYVGGTGSGDIPGTSQVLFGVVYTSSDGSTSLMGAYKQAAPPDPKHVLKSIVYSTADGNATAVTGTLEMPPEAYVLPGYSYTSNSGTVTMGTLAVPNNEEVLVGIQYTSASGNKEYGTLVLPSAGQVVRNVAYGPQGRYKGTFPVEVSTDLTRTTIFGEFSVSGNTELAEIQVSGNFISNGNTVIGYNQYPAIMGSNGQGLIADGSGNMKWETLATIPVKDSDINNDLTINSGNITNTPISGSSASLTTLDISGNTTIGDNVADTLMIISKITGNTLVFEGNTIDSVLTTLEITDPTSNRTIKLPDASGTLALVENISTAYPSMQLNNLSSVAINQSLTPASGNSIDLGSSSKSYRNIFVDANVNFGSVVLNEKDFEYLLGITKGMAQAGRALIADDNINISGINNLSMTNDLSVSDNVIVDGNLYIRNGEFEIGSVQISSSELSVIDGVISGNGIIGKALVLDSTASISEITNISTANLVASNQLSLSGCVMTGVSNDTALTSTSNSTLATTLAIKTFVSSNITAAITSSDSYTTGNVQTALAAAKAYSDSQVASAANLFLQGQLVSDANVVFSGGNFRFNITADSNITLPLSGNVATEGNVLLALSSAISYSDLVSANVSANVDSFITASNIRLYDLSSNVTTLSTNVDSFITASNIRLYDLSSNVTALENSVSSQANLWILSGNVDSFIAASNIRLYDLSSNVTTLSTNVDSFITASNLRLYDLSSNVTALENSVSSQANLWILSGNVDSFITASNIRLYDLSSNVTTLSTNVDSFITASNLRLYDLSSNVTTIEGNISSLTMSSSNISLAGNFQTAGNVTFAGVYDSTFTLTNTTNLTLPTSGTLITSSSTETLTNKTIYSSTMSGNMIVSDNLEANGNVTLGLVSADNITINGNLSINDGLLYTGAVKPKRTIVLTSEGATLGNSGNATRTLIDGTGYSYYVLEYPYLTSSANAYWNWIMPDSYDGGGIDVSIYWNSGGSSTNPAHWAVKTGSINEGTILGDTLSGTGNILKASQGDSKMTISNLSISSPGWSAGNLTIFRVYRDLNTDSLAATANLLRVKIEYSVNNESD